MSNSDISYYIEWYTDNYKDGTFSLEYLKEKLALLESVEHKWANHRNYNSYYASVDALKIVIRRIENDLLT